ncbi:DUF4188 domain-containing protein [Intrasporangium calvum]|uniref:DUF4188 domain-containing protein n=1 Tax=Intrasporangium calvum TaxID=53358 RepID=A0ABT5GHQ4_9MICO|nr:DUF4188 domain-containing protein [Intrasporangium calvum]MDC5697216.1 DUF4188 domain-containing protein [Intrasporangium calvum]
MPSPFRPTTHDHAGSIAVFLIGLRVNHFWRPDLWLPALRAMGPMMTELHAAKAAAARGEGEDLGFLGHRSLIGAGGPTIVQYWRSAEDIYAYSGSGDRAHRPAARAFYERGRRAAGAVGVWHETYAVPAGGHESLYLAMPPTGLAAATGVSELATRRGRASLSGSPDGKDEARSEVAQAG